MTVFTATIKKFGQQGEKTGWVYLEIPAATAQEIKPGNKRSFRVHGKLDDYGIDQLSILPMGDGNFILPLNATVRKAIQKTTGAIVKLQLAEDTRPLDISPELLECLNDEPIARHHFQSLPPSHQQYFSKWILEAKTEGTRTKRLALTMQAMEAKLSFSEMIRNSRRLSS